MNTPSACLLIDAGNTRVKFGWRQRGQGLRNADTLALAHEDLQQLPAWLAALPLLPAAALGVSVASDALMSSVEALLEQHCGLSMQWLQSSACEAGILNLYDNPAQLGNDRWTSLIGLSGHCHSSAVLASFGTATTIDTLGPQGQGAQRNFLGGLILPGPELMRRSLASGTARLPYAESGSVVFPRNTHNAIGSGIAAAQAGAVIRQWRHAQRELGQTPLLFCTGGGWPLVADEMAAALALAQSDAGVPPQPPIWLAAPILDGLATLDQATAG